MRAGHPRFGSRDLQDFEFFSQSFDLIVIEDADAGQIAVFMKECDLGIAEAIPLPIFGFCGAGKQIANRMVAF